ncbi:MAG: hypothetical protein ACHQ1D_10950 [Nitrososphaerales archaeon]
MDNRCVSAIRSWIEAPISSCIKEWLIVPRNYCGLGIPSFQNRVELLRLGKRRALRDSKNENIRELWSDSVKSNINSDSLLNTLPLNQAVKTQKNVQVEAAINHFSGLESQGRIAKTVSECIPGPQINMWSQVLNQLPGHIFNFTRKAVQSQLPTFANLHRWNRAPSNLCPMCGQIQSNKHVLSNCGSSGALSRYTNRHNTILKLLINWIAPKLQDSLELYHDLSLPESKHITDIFNNVRPDIAIKSASRIVVLELTVCHETNFQSSRNYKLDKYKNIHKHRSEIIKHLPVTVCTCEVSVLGFVIIDQEFLKACKLPSVDGNLFNTLCKSAINSSFEIYNERNT